MDTCFTGEFCRKHLKNLAGRLLTFLRSGRDCPRDRRCRDVGAEHHTSLEPLEPRLMLSADLQLVESGLKGDFFDQLQATMNAGVLSAPVPLLGDQLATEPFGQIAAAIRSNLDDFSLGTGNVTTGLVRQRLLTALGDMVVSDGVAVLGADGDSEIRFQLTLGGFTLYTAAGSLDLALGPNAPLSPMLDLDEALNVAVDWTYDLTFGVREDEFFIVTSDPHELSMDVTADLRGDFMGIGRLGLFAVWIQADQGDYAQPSTFSTPTTA